jgi:hypothetical protein
VNEKPNRKYSFTCVETDENGLENVSIKSFTTDNDSWAGFDGPVYNFHNFLKCCGFNFKEGAEMGFMTDEEGDFQGCTEWEWMF